MMVQKINNSNNGIGFFGLLTVLFVALKLMGQIDWSWWWVFAPIWAPVALLLSIALICFVVAVFIKS